MSRHFLSDSETYTPYFDLHTSLHLHAEHNKTLADHHAPSPQTSPLSVVSTTYQKRDHGSSSTNGARSTAPSTRPRCSAPPTSGSVPRRLLTTCSLVEQTFTLTGHSSRTCLITGQAVITLLYLDVTVCIPLFPLSLFQDIVLMSAKDTWKRQRKLCNHLMHTSSLASLHDYPTLERNRFLYLLSQSPEDYIEYIEQFTSRTISRLSWGSAHPAQILRHTTFGLLQTISPSGALPNVISFLRHLPLALSPWKKKEKARHELEDKQFRSNVGFVRRMVDLGRAEPSFIRTFLEEQASALKVKGEEEKKKEADEAMHVVGLIAIAGALTIGSPIQSYILAMCHYPEWQARLQEEIDRELGGRCPMWEDREKLPLLRAVVKEVIRWRPPVPTGEFMFPCPSKSPSKSSPKSTSTSTPCSWCG